MHARIVSDRLGKRVAGTQGLYSDGIAKVAAQIQIDATSVASVRQKNLALRQKDQIDRKRLSKQAAFGNSRQQPHRGGRPKGRIDSRRDPFMGAHAPSVFAMGTNGLPVRVFPGRLMSSLQEILMKMSFKFA